jgi:hypothetical protein
MTREDFETGSGTTITIEWKFGPSQKADRQIMIRSNAQFFSPRISDDFGSV